MAAGEAGWGGGQTPGGPRPQWPRGGGVDPQAGGSVQETTNTSLGWRRAPPSSDPSPPRARPRRHRRALTAQVGRPPEHAGALLGALLGVGGHGGAEALTVPTGVTGAGVMDTGFIEGLGVHLGEKPPCALVCTALMGQACPAGLRNAGPRGHPAPGPRHTTQGLATPGYADLSLGARGLQL